MLLAGFLAGVGAYKGILEASEAVVISRSKSEGFDKQRESLADLRRQHEFVVRYLRYEMTKPVELQFNEPRPTSDEVELSERMFVSLISKWWTKQEELDGELVLNPQVIRKGLDPTIDFSKTHDNYL